MTQPQTKDFITADEFRAAIGTQQLSLHYQPIVLLADERLAGLEALMRWQHPAKGNISPAIFIPLAEESGLIIEASRWALREACKGLKRLERRAGLSRDIFISVNFSAHDLTEDNFLDQLYTILSATDMEPYKVHLEITEMLLMNQPESAKYTLDFCRRAGLSIAIDDFGTHGADPDYIHHYPINTLKIDQSFVRAMTGEDHARKVVETIIALAKAKGMNCIAEGVEHEEEADLLKKLGCSHAQGYYFARPQSESDIGDVMMEWRKDGRVR